MRFVYLLAFVSILLLSTFSLEESSAAGGSCETAGGNKVLFSPTPENDLKCKNVGFRYLIMENVLFTPKIRRIEVFMDVSAFSEENLKKLFSMLSESNPDPTHLTIAVKTDWQQLPVSDCPFGLSSRPDEPNRLKFHAAIFSRRGHQGSVEFFQYNPILGSHNEVEVVLKGQRTEQLKK